MLTLLMVSVVSGQGRIQRGRMRGMHIFPPAIFKTVFDAYNFSIMPYTLATHNRKCANKMHHIWRSSLLRIRVQKFIQNLPENYSKSTKIAITACEFSKNFRGSIPPGAFRSASN